MSEKKSDSLKHDKKLGEVDPKTYPFLCNVHLNTEEIGATERTMELNRLTRALDHAAQFWDEWEDGARQVELRIHYLKMDDVIPSVGIAVHVQPLNVPLEGEARFMQHMVAAISSLEKTGLDSKHGGWTLV